MKDQWNERYSAEAYVYGEEPNEWLKHQLLGMPPCRILFPAEGEGRNAVFAAGLGFDVCAFDISEIAREKAVQLAAKHNVNLNYEILDVAEISGCYSENSFDAIALIYAHFNTGIRRTYHRALLRLLKPNGLLLIEAFTKKQLPFTSGGPKNESLLCEVNEIEIDFAEAEMQHVLEYEVDLNEGLLHQGKAFVLRGVIRK
ncbi:MAG TPA: class I SAM-dependent methyltransferase [Bacteroidales bacterium]|nr:class I SAM-dependent methyltransferase [Bacteroidales bacterium]